MFGVSLNLPLRKGILQTLKSLNKFAKEEGEKETAEKCNKLVDGCKKCLEAVIATKGCTTKY